MSIGGYFLRIKKKNLTNPKLLNGSEHTVLVNDNVQSAGNYCKTIPETQIQNGGIL